MNKKLNIAFEKFQRHFCYSPGLPSVIDFNQDEYATELLQCVEDDFDYTIDKYGTVPKPWNPSKNGYNPDYID